MIMSMFLGFADVVGTKFFDWPVPGALEVTESTMVLIVFGALAYTQSQRGHIRVELLYNRCRPRVQALLDAFTHLTALAYFGLVCWLGVNEFLYSWELREATMGAVRFPLYPARLLLAVGTFLLLVTLVLDLVDDIRKAVGKAAPAGAPAASNG
jgi:TRAP-type C4-dicarboxylate transport system permease small subunit